MRIIDYWKYGSKSEINYLQKSNKKFLKFGSFYTQLNGYNNIDNIEQQTSIKIDNNRYKNLRN